MASCRSVCPAMAARPISQLRIRQARPERTGCAGRGNAHWFRERIEYDAAYGKERAVAYLFLPRNGRPPYQPVIYWPGLYAVTTKENSLPSLDLEGVAFLVKSGRALVWPIYKGTYNRRFDRCSCGSA